MSGLSPIGGGRNTFDPNQGKQKEERVADAKDALGYMRERLKERQRWFKERMRKLVTLPTPRNVEPGLGEQFDETV